MTALQELQALEREHVVPAYARMPVAFVRGEGARLWDSEGVEYLDFQTGLAVTSLGHGHPAVVAAIREQAAGLVHVGNLFYNEPGMRLAPRLAESSLGGKVHFANSGTEANEAALKVARKAKPGGTIISVHRGFHGRTYGSLSATPQESKQAPFAPLVPGFFAVAPTAAAVAGAVDERTAAVILEPVQGESGVHVLDDVRRKGDRLLRGLDGLSGGHARGRGLMVAFGTDDGPALVKRALLDERLVLNATGPDTVRALPPLTVSEDEIDEALARLHRLV